MKTPNSDIVPARRHPDERHQRGEDADARDRRIGHGGDGALGAAHHARHDQRAGPGQRRDEREKRRGMKRAGARPQDDQHADQADAGRDPAAQADLLAEKNDRQRGDEQRRDEAGGGGFRDRQEPQAGNEEQRRAQHRHAAHQLQAEPVGLQRKQRRTRHHRRRHDQREHQKPDPRDLDRRQRRREIFRRHVGGAEKDRRGQNQRDALERPVGARGRLAGGGLLLGQRQWSAVQPCGCGGGRCHGNLEGSNDRIGRGCKKHQSAAATRSENRMRICADGGDDLHAELRRRTNAIETLC